MSTDEPAFSDRIRADVPHSARVWNRLLGGKDNYPADRQVAEQITAHFPGVADIARMQRYFLARAVRFLAGEAGVRQFLDIGTGLPTVDNTHEVAQRVAPASRIVYVDNDPLVLAHAQALLTSSPEGVCAYVDADVRDPGAIVEQAARTLDLSRPVGLTMMGIMGQLADEDDPHAIVARLMEALPPGSYLALCDGVNTNETLNEAIAAYNAGDSANSYHLRTPERIAAFFDGLEPVAPGVVAIPQWRPEVTTLEPVTDVEAYGGVGRKR